MNNLHGTTSNALLKSKYVDYSPQIQQIGVLQWFRGEGKAERLYYCKLKLLIIMVLSSTYKPMLLISDGNSEIGAHVMSEIGDMI